MLAHQHRGPLFGSCFEFPGAAHVESQGLGEPMEPLNYPEAAAFGPKFKRLNSSLLIQLILSCKGQLALLRPNLTVQL